MDRQMKSPDKFNTDRKTSSKAKTSSGLKKEKENNNNKPITEWFYMSKDTVSAKMISEVLKAKGFDRIELWDEMNILQIELPDRKAVDFEPLGYDFKDPSDAAFVKNRGIKTVFAVTIEAGAFDLFKPLLEFILKEWEGFLCADSNDFKPIYGFKELS